MRKIFTAFMMMLCAVCMASAANYLTFTAEEDSSSFGIVNNGYNNPDVQYSLDGGETWTALAAGDTITLAHKGDKALLRGDNPEGFSKGHGVYSSFTMTGKIAASGSVMSLNDGVGISTEVPGNFCFYKLFQGCTSLTQAPELPATILKDYCYADMFSGCTSLTEVPELPATALIDNCYNSMFKNCTGLTRAYLLFVDMNLNVRLRCLSEMFSGCTNLSEISVVFDEWIGYTQYWVYNVAPTGTFYCPKALPLEYGVDRIPEGWTVKYIDDTVAAETNYLTFTAEEDGSSFGIVNNGGNNPDVQYSLDGGKTWTALSGGEMVTLTHKGDKALLRGDNPEGFSKDWRQYSAFKMTGKVAASGSVMSLIDGLGLSTEILWEKCFVDLFENCTSLTQAPELPATVLSTYCYDGMFSGCTSLTQAPELPATTLAEGCYGGMFYHCTSLTQAPELPATTLAEGCYYEMFSGCTNLSEIKVSFDDWNDGDYTLEWVLAVAPTGTFICPKDLPLVYRPEGIPEGWTVKYIDDTVAAEPNYLTFTAEEDSSTFGIVNINNNNPDVQYSLDGGKTWTALAEGDTVVLAHKGDKALLKGNNPEGFSFSKWDNSSFRMTGKVAASGSVMSLIDGVGISTEVPGNFCFYKLFEGCTSLTQAPELPATILADNCYWGMFYHCTSLTQAPELPATTLAEGCYYEMFSGCTSLSEIKVPFDDWNRGHYTAEWVIDVAPTGTFICPKTLALEYGWESIPEGWTVKYIEDMTNYLTFTAEEDGSSFGIVSNEGNNPDVQYSLDGGKTWTTLAVKDAITLAHKGDKALLRGGNSRIFSKGLSQYSSFTMTGKVAASGSVMSLIDRTGLSTEIPGNYCFYSLFAGCTGLTQAPELPATTLTEDCYRKMFSGCTGLTQAPELPATTLAGYCYLSMFSGCTGLTQAPELPATTLAEACYVAMFSDCTNLTQAPELPSTTLAQRCYESMFSGCTSLTLAPELPATNLAFGCYSHMFLGCTSLAQTPKLPATTLVASCYQSMFSDCVSLTSADLSFEQYVGERSCCNDMFRGCTNLSEIKVSFEEWGYGDLENPRWVENVALTGTFICPKDLPIEYGVSRIPAGWTVKNIIDGDTVDVPINYNYLTFTAEEDGSSFGIVNYYDNNPYVQYSLDGGETWTALTEGDSVVLAHKGDKALLRGVNPQGISRDGQYSTFKMTGKVAASGSVMSLIDGMGKTLVVPAGDCFYSLFKGCTSLTQAPELPATTLAERCYNGMFSGCTSLTEAPELPAMTLANSCYFSMFYDCSSLTQAPELLATTLTESCYRAMFYGCTSLTQAPELPATTLAEYCYYDMFYGCTSLTQAPELPATTLADDCYNSMFRCCTSLTQAPELPATTLDRGCYAGMFQDCTSLTQAPELPATSLSNYCYNSMFRGCTSLTQAPELTATTLASCCYEFMFSGCTSLTQAPELPATSLSNYCYVAMFNGCTSLTQAPELPATTLAGGCYNSMFLDCTSLTEAPELPATTLADMCYRSMFEGCTSLTQAPELPAPELIAHSNAEIACYREMFSGCTNLSEISVAFVEWGTSIFPSDENTYRWVKDVAPTGTFICPKALALEYGVNRIPEGWTVKYAEEGSGVSSALAEGVTVWTDDLTIFVRGAEGEVSLYDVSGRIVATSNSKDEERALSVPAKGVYVVRTNNGTSDVLVR